MVNGTCFDAYIATAVTAAAVGGPAGGRSQPTSDQLELAHLHPQQDSSMPTASSAPLLPDSCLGETVTHL
jgi:hypothetical protein